jgi:error-prone DNA polymerase
LKDVGKAMGLSVDTIEGLTSNVWGYEDEWFEKHGIKHQGLNTSDKHLKKIVQLANEYMGFPRQLGQHTGGFVITKGKLSDLCPLLNARMEARTCIEWNKDDIDALGFMKIDVLALGMLTCIRKAFDLARQHYGLHFTLANIPQDDPKVYEMVSHADTIGVFQIESRAQQSMLPRLRPKCFYDLVIEVAIVRPGPIQGDMVHPYLRRRNGEEPVDYPSPELEEILGRTLGVPLFQEQAMKIAIVAAGFTPAEADALRRSMATFKLQGLVSQFEEKLISGMKSRGYSEEYAKRVFKQLEGFGSYGFPESHAASFALLVYVSSWIKCYYPDVFACALLNSMPMGFYQPAQIIIDAKNHSVNILPIDINYSHWDNTLEQEGSSESSSVFEKKGLCKDDFSTGKIGTSLALRLGFRQIGGMREEDAQRLIAARTKPFTALHELRVIGLSDAALEKLADADAFHSIGLDRREALWKASTKDTPVCLFKGHPAAEEKAEAVSLPEMTASEQVVQDYASTSLSIKAHPVSFIREKLSQLHVASSKDLSTKKNGDKVKVAGIVLVRQRPGTAKGVCFMTIEDETGWINAVIFANLFDRQRKEVLQSTLILLEGKLQIEGEVVHVIVKRCYDLSKLLRHLTSPKSGSSVAQTLPFPADHNAGEKAIPGARDFK